MTPVLKFIPLVCILLAQSIHAMPARRPVSMVSGAVVTHIKTAISNSRYDLVLQALREIGLSINSQLTNKLETVLHFAVKSNQQEIVEQLLTDGADIFARNRFN